MSQRAVSFFFHTHTKEETIAHDLDRLNTTVFWVPKDRKTVGKNSSKSTYQDICAVKSCLLSFQNFCHYTLTFRIFSLVFVPLFQYPDPPRISVSDGKVKFLALSVLTFQNFCHCILIY